MPSWRRAGPMPGLTRRHGPLRPAAAALIAPASDAGVDKPRVAGQARGTLSLSSTRSACGASRKSRSRSLSGSCQKLCAARRGGCGRRAAAPAICGLISFTWSFRCACSSVSRSCSRVLRIFWLGTRPWARSRGSRPCRRWPLGRRRVEDCRNIGSDLGIDVGSSEPFVSDLPVRVPRADQGWRDL